MKVVPIDGAPRTDGWRASLLPPVVVFVAAELVVTITVWTAGYPPFSPTTWRRWDSGHYLAVAAHGYSVPRCVARDCGHAGWFPGLPALTRAVSTLGVPLNTSMLFLSRAFFLGTLVLVWNGLLRRDTSPRGLIAMAFAACCPGSLYFHTLFPMSAATFFVVGCLLLMVRRRWVLAGLAGALAVTTYPATVALGPAAVLWLLLDRREPPGEPTPTRGRVKAAAIVGGGVLLGGLSVMAVQWTWTGSWHAYTFAQAQFPLHRSVPFLAWYRYVDDLWTHPGARLIVFQCLLTGLLMVAVAVSEVRLRSRGLPLLVLVYGFAVWIFPLTLSQYSLYRTDSLLLPLAVLVARLPTRLALVLVTISAVLMWQMTYLFLDSTII